MTILQALILGIIQGLTELLPISSSGHLDVLPWLFGWTNSSEFNASFEGFDVALHFGTLLAIGLFFFKDWIKLITKGFALVFKKEKTNEGKMFWYIVCATLPGGLIGLLLDKFVGDGLKKPWIIAIALIVMGIVLYIVDKTSKSNIKYEIIPGVSRSGITMTTGRIMGIDRESCAKYSFMLSAPIVLAATVLKLKDFVFSIPFFVGVIASFLVGIFVIKFLLEYLKKGSFKIFSIYRIIFGLIIIVFCIIK